MENQPLTEIIIGCAFRVFNELGFGFLESVYENAMFLELQESGLKAETQMPVRVLYKGRQVGDFVADILVEDEIILELKSVLRLIEAHEVQLVNYLVATGISTGLLINFGKSGVEVKRKYREFQTPRNSSIENMGFESSDY
jgi:GxxExxY protein